MIRGKRVIHELRDFLAGVGNRGTGTGEPRDVGKPGTLPNYTVLLRTLRPRSSGRLPSQVAIRLSAMV